MGQNNLAILTGDHITVGFSKKMCGRFAEGLKKVAIITRWPYYWGGRKAGFDCTIFDVKPGIIILNFKIYQVIK